MKPESCKNCKFWKRGTNISDGEKVIEGGLCLRHAPTMLSGSGSGWSDQLWPATKPTDWCGEYADALFDQVMKNK